MDLRVKDNDKDEITVMDGDKEIRGWSYRSDLERRTKMLCAREFVEGWYQGDGRPELAEICQGTRLYHGTGRCASLYEGATARSWQGM